MKSILYIAREGHVNHRVVFRIGGDSSVVPAPFRFPNDLLASSDFVMTPLRVA